MLKRAVNWKYSNSDSVNLSVCAFVFKFQVSVFDFWEIMWLQTSKMSLNAIFKVVIYFFFLTWYLIYWILLTGIVYFQCWQFKLSLFVSLPLLFYIDNNQISSLDILPFFSSKCVSTHTNTLNSTQSNITIVTNRTIIKRP